MRDRAKRPEVGGESTKADWAEELAGLLEGRYAECEKVILVCDNLNTHTKGAFYEVFEPTRARELVCRIEFCYTPKHGSWLNIAENELSAMTRQCLRGCRIGDLATLLAIVRKRVFLHGHRAVSLTTCGSRSLRGVIPVDAGGCAPVG